jgi:hypothetical protein
MTSSNALEMFDDEEMKEKKRRGSSRESGRIYVGSSHDAKDWLGNASLSTCTS